MIGLLLSSLLAAQPATPSARWLPFRRETDANSYVDVTTIEIDGDLRRVWQRVDFNSAQGTIDLWSTTFHYEIDCTSRTMRTLAAIGRDRNRRPISTITTPQPAEPVFPDTRAEGLLELVCSATGISSPAR